MKNVVIVGAGKEGKGTFGDIFYENKWNITFIDKDENVINSLNESSRKCGNLYQDCRGSSKRNIR